MKMSRYLVVRIVAISFAILVAAVVLALWRAQFDVEREELGATEMMRLFERLYVLENGPRADVEATLAALQGINASGSLRHVQLDLRDALGHVLVAPAPPVSPTGLRRVFARVAPGLGSWQSHSSGPWTLQRDDGDLYVATLSLNPASEQQEALDNLLGMLVVLLGYGLAMLLAVYWTLQRALAPLQPILGAIAHYERNDFAQRLPALPFAEMDTIGRALNRLAGTLDAAQEERRALSLKLVSSQEDERARIARELHDEFGQGLTAMRADTTWLLRKCADRADLREVLQGLAQQCEHLHLGVRDLLARLRPHAANASANVPLRRMLDDLLSGWRTRSHGATRFALHCDVDVAAIPADLALAVYRMTQEALTNAVRHAQATAVDVALAGDADGALRWAVSDDGIGIDSIANAMPRGNGLAGLRERVWALGGDFDIGPVQPRGVRPGLRVAARFAAPRSPLAGDRSGP